MTCPREGFVVSKATALATTSTVEETEAGLRLKLKFTRFVNLQPKIFGLGGLKALELNVDGVHADGKQIHDVVPGVICFGFACDTRALRG